MRHEEGTADRQRHVPLSHGLVEEGHASTTLFTTSQLYTYTQMYHDAHFDNLRCDCDLTSAHNVL